METRKDDGARMGAAEAARAAKSAKPAARRGFDAATAASIAAEAGHADPEELASQLDEVYARIERAARLGRTSIPVEESGRWCRRNLPLAEGEWRPRPNLCREAVRRQLVEDGYRLKPVEYDHLGNLQEPRICICW